jgi:hypothetical protein
MSHDTPRTVMAPPPSPASMKSLPNRVFSVVLQADEDVEWAWTHTADGTSYVSGYTVVKKQ